MLRNGADRASSRARGGNLAEPLSIVQVLAAGSYGGLESVVLNLASGLADRGHRSRVLAVLDLEPDPHPFVRRLAEAGVEVEGLRLPARTYRRERRELSARLTAMRPDVVHSHGYRADLQAGAVAKGLGLPRVSTLHGFTGGGLRMRVYERLQERTLRRFEAVVAVSAPIASRLEAAGVPGDRIHLLRNAWHRRSPPLPREAARAELGIAEDARVAGWVGRLSPEKGPDLLLEALALSRHRDASACFVGDGPQARLLDRQAADLGLGDRVRWAGPRADAGRLFPAFDVFVLSSRTEGTPMVLFEAAEAGVPIVATRVGGVPDVLPVDAAWLVETESPEKLAAALDEALGSPEAAGLRAASARRRVDENFALAPWLERYEEIYRSLRARRA